MVFGLVGKAGSDLVGEDIDLPESCEACLAKGGGWCISEQRCGEDDTAHCEVDDLIGLAGYTNDCRTDKEGRRPKERRRLDKGVLVSFTHENGTCCGTGIVNRAYHILEEYTVLLRDGSREEVKLLRWENRKPGKKKDEGSEYHNIEFRYFRARELTVVSGVRPKDMVRTHFAVKQQGLAAGDDAPLVRSRAVEEAVVINTTLAGITVNYTKDLIVSVVPHDWVEEIVGVPPAHEEL